MNELMRGGGFEMVRPVSRVGLLEAIRIEKLNTIAGGAVVGTVPTNAHLHATRGNEALHFRMTRQRATSRRWPSPSHATQDESAFAAIGNSYTSVGRSGRRYHTANGVTIEGTSARCATRPVRCMIGRTTLRFPILPQ